MAWPLLVSAFIFETLAQQRRGYTVIDLAPVIILLASAGIVFAVLKSRDAGESD